MPTAESTGPAPTNITERRQPVKKKPRLTNKPASKSGTPNAYARRSPPRDSKPLPRSPSQPATTANPHSHNNSDSETHSPPRKLKRPGTGARIATANREAAEALRRQREMEAQKAVQERQTGAAELVADHYNAVPERGRTWRQKDSQIAGLRSLNNWVKSTLIQKFSLPEDHDGGSSAAGESRAPLLVLDMACGKGGDLGKWEKAPQPPSLYVGCDIAGVSIEQATARWQETLSRSRGRNKMQVEFYVHDAFSVSLGEIARVRQVGFNPNAGPGGSGIISAGMGGGGGFDVVSMMFALHYSFESEKLARGMLKNVAGALKKGGRFLGVMPNSDIISSTVKRMLAVEKDGKTPDGKLQEHLREGDEEGEIVEDGEVKEEEEDDDDEWDPEKPSEPNGNNTSSNPMKEEEEEEDEWDPEKPSVAQPTTVTNGTTHANTSTTSSPDWDPSKPSSPPPAKTPPGITPTQSSAPLPPLEWGNSKYTIRFPRTQPLTQLPLPLDGIFRPPFGWRYHYHLEEAVDVPEYVVPWEAFRALAEEYGLELLYRKGFKEILEDEGMRDGGRDGGELRRLAERMGVLGRDGALRVGGEELEAAGFYLGFVFYRT